ncbi:MAG: methyltransferase, partial [Paracoccaceae bacterium]
PDTGRATALQVATPITAWVASALRRLAPGGPLTMILSTDLLPAALTLAPHATILPLAPREHRPAPRVILQVRKLGRAPFRLLPPFVIHAGEAHDGDRESYTPAANAVLRDGGPLTVLFR